MTIIKSPFSGKPMRVVYEPEIMEFRGEKFHYTHIAFRDDEAGEQFTTTESDMACYNQVTNQYREKHGIPYVDEIIETRKKYGLSASKMSLVLGFGANQYRLYEDSEVPNESHGKMIRSAANPKVFLGLVHGAKHLFSENDYSKTIALVQSLIDDSGQ